MIGKVMRYQRVLGNSNTKQFPLWIIGALIGFSMPKNGEGIDIIKMLLMSGAFVLMIRELYCARSMPVQLTPASLRFQRANMYLLNLLYLMLLCSLFVALTLITGIISFVFSSDLSMIIEICNSVFSSLVEMINNPSTYMILGLYLVNSMLSTTIVLKISNRHKQMKGIAAIFVVLSILGYLMSYSRFEHLFASFCLILAVLIPIYVCMFSKS